MDALDAVNTDDVLAAGTEELGRVELRLDVVERIVECHGTTIMEISSRDSVLGDDVVDVLHVEHRVAIVVLHQEVLPIILLLQAE